MKERTGKYLTIPRCAELSGFSVRQFRRFVEQDEIPIMRMGKRGPGHCFITADDFRSWWSTKGFRRFLNKDSGQSSS